MSDNKKILTLSYLVVSLLLAFSMGLLLEAASGFSPEIGRIIGMDVVKHGVPILAGFITFFVLQFNKKINVFCDEVVTEVKKIVWPSRRDTVAMTIVVCVMVVLAGFTLAMFDAASGYIVGQLKVIPLP